MVQSYDLDKDPIIWYVISCDLINNSHSFKSMQSQYVGKEWGDEISGLNLFLPEFVIWENETFRIVENHTTADVTLCYHT